MNAGGLSAMLQWCAACCVLPREGGSCVGLAACFVAPLPACLPVRVCEHQGLPDQAATSRVHTCCVFQPVADAHTDTLAYAPLLLPGLLQVSDAVLTAAFQKFPTFQKAKVVRYAHNGKSKGYGFASFGDMIEGTKVLREMDGKYIGEHCRSRACNKAQQSLLCFCSSCNVACAQGVICSEAKGPRGPRAVHMQLMPGCRVSKAGSL